MLRKLGIGLFVLAINISTAVAQFATSGAAPGFSTVGGLGNLGVNPQLGTFTPVRTVLAFGTVDEYPLTQIFRYSDATSVCNAWGSGSTQCTEATNWFDGYAGTTPATPMIDTFFETIRGGFFSSRASVFSAPIVNLTTAGVTGITNGSLNFSTDQTSIAVTGCNLSTVSVISGSDSTATSLANLLQKCINAAASSGSNRFATITGGVITSARSGAGCTATGYSSNAWLVVTAMGTCSKIYHGMAEGSSFVTAQMADGSNNPCINNPNCNGTTGTYNMYVAPGTIGTFLTPVTLTFNYSILTYTSLSGTPGTIALNDWITDGCVSLFCSTSGYSASQTAVNDVDTDSVDGCNTQPCWVVTYQSANVASETMYANSAAISVKTSSPSSISFRRNGNFNPDYPNPSNITLVTSNSTASTDNLATVLGLTQAAGAWTSSTGNPGSVGNECNWLHTISQTLDNRFVTFYNTFTGPGYPPGSSANYAACAAAIQPAGRIQFQPWNSSARNQPAYLSFTPLFSLLISGGGGTGYATSPAKYALMTGGFSVGSNGTFSNVSQIFGMDAVLWNTSFYWSAAPAASGNIGFGAGILNQVGGVTDIINPVEQMSVALFPAAASGYPMAKLQDWGAGPALTVYELDNLAFEMAPYNTPTTAPTNGASASAIVQSFDCACGTVFGGSSTALLTTGVSQYLALATSTAPSATEYTHAIMFPAAASVEGISLQLSAALTNTVVPTAVSCTSSCTASPVIQLTFAAMGVAPVSAGTFTLAGVNGCTGTTIDAAQTISSSSTTTITFTGAPGANCSGTLTLATPLITLNGTQIAVTLRHNIGTTGVTAWTGTITPGQTGLTLCAVAMSGCTTPTMTAASISAGDFLDIKVVGTDLTNSAPSVFESLVYQPATAGQSFIFGGSATTFPSGTSPMYASGVGLSPWETTDTSPSLLGMLIPSLAAYGPTHPSAFTVGISDLTVAYFDATNSEANRQFGFNDWSYSSGWTTSTAATTQANCQLAAAAGATFPTAGFNPGGQTTSWYTCSDSVDAAWTPAGFDRFVLETTMASANTTAGIYLLWSAVAVVQ